MQLVIRHSHSHSHSHSHNLSLRLPWMVSVMLCKQYGAAVYASASDPMKSCYRDESRRNAPQPQDGSAAHMAELRADRERERELRERRDREVAQAHAEQMRVSLWCWLNCYDHSLVLSCADSRRKSRGAACRRD